MELPKNEVISDIIEELMIERANGNLYDFVEGKSDSYFYDWMVEIARETDLETAEGETKMVFFSPKIKDWVIKIPRYSKDIDYCKIEVENYKKACEVHLEEFFAPTYFVGYFFEIPVYIQKQVYCDDSDIESSFYDWMSKSMEDERDDYNTDDDFCDAVCDATNDMCTADRLLAVFQDYVNSDKIYALLCFCNREDINDLHSGNFGYDGNTPVIVDFSGYKI